MKFAYADPPYIGNAHRHYRNHPDYAGEVDHVELIDRLEAEYDGWALSATMKSLPQIMKLCADDLLTLAWVNPSAVPMGDHRHYSWEPVILRPLRRPAVNVKCHLVASPPGYTFRPKPASFVIGQKPEVFSFWVFEAAGLTADDEFDDLYPGSGAVGRAWDAWRAQGRLLVAGVES